MSEVLDLTKYNSGPQSLPTKNETVQVTALVEELKYNRGYSLTDTSLRPGTALLTRSIVSLNDDVPPQREHVVMLLERIAEFEPTLTQRAWRGTPPPKLPELPRNPLDGTYLPSPYAANPVDRRGVNAVLTNQPELAALLERLHEDAWGTVYELRKAAADWEENSKIRFEKSDYITNPWRDKSAEASRAQLAFRLAHGDRLAEIYEFEASEISLPWSASEGATHRSTNSKIILSLEQNPIPEISKHCIMLANAYDVKILDHLRLVAEDEANAAVARAAALK